MSLKKTEKVEIMSVVGFKQLFSAKSQISLSASLLQFYRLHTKLLKIDEDIPQKLISDDRTVFAYLPTQFYKSIVCAKNRIIIVRDVWNKHLESRSPYQRYTKALTMFWDQIELLLDRVSDLVLEKENIYFSTCS